MLHFLRQIRQKLILQDNIKKYLLYALGEILLVVIGILIALQINNWNQDRLDRIKSVEYHQRLIDDLGFIISQRERSIERSEQLTDYLKHSVLLLQKGELTETGKDTLDFALSNFNQFVRIGSELNSYEEMKSTGQLGLIYNAELREKINAYLALLEAIRQVFDTLADKVNDTSIIDQYVTVILRPSGGGSNSVNYDFKQMASDQTLINVLSRFALYWQTRTVFVNQISSQTEVLKGAIEQELSNL